MLRLFTLVALLSGGCSESDARASGAAQYFTFQDPRSISGCKAWLRSDLGITLNSGNVSNWANQISPGTGDASQATAGKQPGYNTSGGPNGRPRIITAPSTAALQWSLNLQGAKTVVFVGKATSTPGTGVAQSAYSIKGSTGPVFSEWAYINSAGYQPSSFIDDVGSTGVSGVGIADTPGTTTHVYITTYNGSGNTTPGNYTENYDGVAKTVVASSTFSRTLTDLGSIGARIDSANNISATGWPGEVYELIVYNRVLTTSEQEIIYKYVRALYNL